MATQFMDDQQLVGLYCNGNESALSTLIHRHQQRIFSYIMMVVKDKEIAEDVFQDTFFKVVNTLKKGNYNEEGKFLPWVLRISHNVIIDHFRRNKRFPKVDTICQEDGEELDIFNLIKSPENDAEQNIVNKQNKKELRKIIEELPDEQREVLMMRHYYDMSFKEISEKTNVSINTALGRMRYALINLRNMIEERNLAFVE